MNFTKDEGNLQIGIAFTLFLSDLSMNNQVYIFQKPSFYYIFVNKRLWELPQNTYSLTLGTYIKLQQYVKKVNIV
nr:hypothetical protein P5640_09420 [Bacillus subtilis]